MSARALTAERIRWKNLSAAFRADRVIMAIVFAGGIVGGWALLPGENERVAMLERDGHSREALTILEQQVAAGDSSYRTLHQIVALYEEEGNVAKAKPVLEAMLQERPRDVALKQRLAQFYKNIQNEDAYIATLQDIISIRYSETACRDLIARLEVQRRCGCRAGRAATLPPERLPASRRFIALRRTLGG